MDDRAAIRELEDVLNVMLARPRRLPTQTLRHLEQHVDDLQAGLAEFLANAIDTLEDYEYEILFAPVFTPSPEEQLEITEALSRSRIAPGAVGRLAARLAASVTRCPLVLPSGATADLRVGDMLIERFVSLLRLEAAPEKDIVEAVRELMPPDLTVAALASLRRRGMSPRHHEWYTRFLAFAVDRHAFDRDAIELLAEFLAGRSALDSAALLGALDSLLAATRDASSFAQKGRMYWSSDVAEHHQFRGQGAVDGMDVERREREVRALELLRSDLEAFASVYDSLETGAGAEA